MDMTHKKSAFRSTLVLSKLLWAASTGLHVFVVRTLGAYGIFWIVK